MKISSINAIKVALKYFPGEVKLSEFIAPVLSALHTLPNYWFMYTGRGKKSKL